MFIIFTEQSPYKQRAKYAATGWTLLIFILCFLPGNEIPDVDIPFVDKWAHVILFAIFSFLWLCATPTKHPVHLFIIFSVTLYTGWLVEYVQGHYVSGRTQDYMDTMADGAGGILGVMFFYILSVYSERALKVSS